MPSDPDNCAFPSRYTFHTSASLLINLRRWDDKRSWEEFYGLYRELVYGFARRSGLPHKDAEEATRDVFIRVAMTTQEFDSNPAKGSFRGWLMNLTRAQVDDRLRNLSPGAHILNGRDTEDIQPKDPVERRPRGLRLLSRVARWAGKRPA
jgi:DNA-directed RNA polymerase specialized sigma24 family protein